MKTIYLIGSLRNRKIPKLANEIEALGGYEAFDSWQSPGPEADSYWRKYERARGRNYAEALKGYAGRHIFEFDALHIKRAEIGVLVMKAGKSAHLELGVMLGQGKRGYILFDREPSRWDLMYQFCTGIFFSKEDLFKELEKIKKEK